MSTATTSVPRRARLQPLPIAINTSATFIGNVFYTLCQAGFVVALARLSEPAVVGQFALGLAVSSPIALLASLQLRSVQVVDAANRNSFAEYLGLRIITSALAVTATAIAATLVAGSRATILVIVLIGVLRNVQAISDVYRGLMQRFERMERVAISTILRGAAELPVFVIILLLHGRLTLALTAMVVADIVIWWTWDVRSARALLQQPPGERDSSAVFGITPRFDSQVLVSIARTALPLGLGGMLLSLNTYAPQYAIKHLQGEAELGIFAALLYAATATNILYGAVGQSASPRLAMYFEAGNAAAFNALHKRMLRFGIASGVLIVALAALFGELALRVVFGDVYAAQARLFVELTVVVIALNTVSLQGYSLTAARYFTAQLPVSVLVALVTIVAAFVFTPRYGVQGAAAAVLCGGVVQGIGYAVLLRHARRRLPQRPTVEHIHAHV